MAAPPMYGTGRPTLPSSHCALGVGYPDVLGLCPPMDPSFAYTVADLARDDALRLRCDCRTRTFTRAELAAAVGRDARLHLIGLHRALWCRVCGEAPFHGWVAAATGVGR